MFPDGTKPSLRQHQIVSSLNARQHPMLPPFAKRFCKMTPLYLGGTQIYQFKTKFTMKGKHVFEITAQHVNGQVENTISASCK